VKQFETCLNSHLMLCYLKVTSTTSLTN